MTKFKHLVLGIILLSLTINYSCKKDKDFDYDKYNFSTKINGELWETWPLKYAAISGENKKEYGIVMGMVDNQAEFSINKDYISIRNFKLTKDTIPIYSDIYFTNAYDTTLTSAFFWMLDDDSLLREYEPVEVEGFKNWLLLTNIKKKEVRGKFQLVVKKNPIYVEKVWPNWPDTLFFSEGEFVAKRND